MSEWISVWSESNPPEIGVDVLVTDGEGILIAHFCEDRIFKTFPDMGCFDDATHWMHLPGLPAND